MKRLTRYLRVKRRLREFDTSKLTANEYQCLLDTARFYMRHRRRWWYWEFYSEAYIIGANGENGGYL